MVATNEAGDNVCTGICVIPGFDIAAAPCRQSSLADCTAHAEMVLVRETQARGGPAAAQGATVYASGEPCAMCAAALFRADVSRVVYAASQAEMTRIMGGPTLPIAARAVLAGASRAVRVDGPWLEAEAAAVLQVAAARTRSGELRGRLALAWPQDR
ncbi:MAG: nucleoside deaminase [Burkholderiales bacterium]|nr:nucleoside deaminase [Burkholderiales bacterium]